MAQGFELGDVPRRQEPLWWRRIFWWVRWFTVNEDEPRRIPVRGVHWGDGGEDRSGQGGGEGINVQPFWSAWANKPELNCHPCVIRRPTSLKELQEAVREAGKKNLKVRVCGQGHSSTPLVKTDGMLITLDGLLKYFIDQDAQTITVTAGVDVNALDRLLGLEGLALRANIVLTSVQIGGVIQAGCHGSGRFNRTVCELVTSMIIVDASGNLRIFSNKDKDSDVFEAAVLALGTFGVVYTLTLQAEPNAWHVAEDKIYNDKKHLLDKSFLKRHVESNDVIDFFWWPYTDKVWARMVNPVNSAPQLTGLAAALQRRGLFGLAAFVVLAACALKLAASAVLAILLLAALVGGIWMCISRSNQHKIRDAFRLAGGGAVLHELVRTPENAPELIKWISSLVQDQTITVRLAEAVHYQRFIPSFGVQFLEVCIPVDSAYANVALAVKHLMDTIDKFKTMGRYPANLTMQLRFVRGSSALLATCYDADARNTPTTDADPLFCYIEILSILHTPDWDNFVKEIGLKWMAIEGALPHWPKQFDQIPEVRALVRQRLGQRLERFREARVRAGVDPNDMFSNAFTDDILFND